MANYSGTDIVTTGCLSLTLRYELYGDVRAAVARNGASIEDVVHLAFQGVADLGNGFNIMYLAFDMAFDNETLQFTVASAPLPGHEVLLGISIVEKPPFSVEVRKLPAFVREAYAASSEEDASR